MGTQTKVRKLRVGRDDVDHEVDKIDADIARLTATIERMGYGSYEAQRAEREVRNLRDRRKRLTR